MKNTYYDLLICCLEWLIIVVRRRFCFFIISKLERSSLKGAVLIILNFYICLSVGPLHCVFKISPSTCPPVKRRQLFLLNIIWVGVFGGKAGLNSPQRMWGAGRPHGRPWRSWDCSGFLELGRPAEDAWCGCVLLRLISCHVPGGSDRVSRASWSSTWALAGWHKHLQR